MPTDEDVKAQFPRFELVEWQYDGLNGKIIPWTKENGGTSDDPSAQAFVVHPDGTVAARAKDCYTPSSFARWLDEQADGYEKEHPTTRMPFVPAEVTAEGEGESRSVKLPALETAVEEGLPVLVYVGRTRADDADRAGKAEVKAARKFEGSTLDSKKAAEAAGGFVLLRLDLADPDHALLAKKRLGVEKAPALLLLLPGEEKPVDLGKISGNSLAYRLKKHTPPNED